MILCESFHITSEFNNLQLTSLELQYVSPKLLVCRDLELAVPGTYDPNQSIIRIQKAQSSLQVITSKQRPRKLSIFGKLFLDNLNMGENETDSSESMTGQQFHGVFVHRKQRTGISVPIEGPRRFTAG